MWTDPMTGEKHLRPFQPHLYDVSRRSGPVLGMPIAPSLQAQAQTRGQRIDSSAGRPSSLHNRSIYNGSETGHEAGLADAFRRVNSLHDGITTRDVVTSLTRSTSRAASGPSDIDAIQSQFQAALRQPDSNYSFDERRAVSGPLSLENMQGEFRASEMDNSRDMRREHISRVLDFEPWRSFETYDETKVPDFMAQDFSSPTGLNNEGLRAYRTARARFFEDYAEALQALMTQRLGIAKKLIARRKRATIYRNDDAGEILDLVQSEAMQRLTLLVEGPRRPDGHDQPLDDPRNWEEPRTVFDLPVQQARRFLQAHRTSLEPHAMHIAGLIQLQRERRPLERQRGARSAGERHRLQGLTVQQRHLRTRLPDWTLHSRPEDSESRPGRGFCAKTETESKRKSRLDGDEGTPDVTSSPPEERPPKARKTSPIAEASTDANSERGDTSGPQPGMHVSQTRQVARPHGGLIWQRMQSILHPASTTALQAPNPLPTL